MNFFKIQIPIEIPKDFTATDVDPEHRVAYWREDVGKFLHLSMQFFFSNFTQ